MVRRAPLTDLSALLADGAAQWSDAIALQSDTWTLTYGQLQHAAHTTAALLRERSATAAPIAICGTNAAEYAMALFGAFADGRPVIELNPQERPERLVRILAGVAPAMIATNVDPSAFSALGIPVVLFDEIGARVRGRATAPPPPAAPRAPDDVAVVVFTSGTTGAPKGVTLTHANLGAVTDAILDYLELQPGDRYALVLPLFHTYGKSVLFTTLRSGGTVVIDNDFADLPRFVERLAQRRITAFSGVPYHVHMLLERAPLDRHDLSGLRLFTISGNHIAPASLERLAQRLRHTAVHFMYGMTETSTRACALPPDQIPHRTRSCGRPIRGVRLRIVDENGRDLPPRQMGEVLIAGPNVMRGYWNDPALTAQVLRDGWLHTGDLGQVDEDGYLYLEGRKNDLIKCAGERFSARDIEEVLAGHPGVLEAAVAGIPHPVLGEMVCAWLVRREASLEAAELRAFCASRLTSHQLPRQFVFLDELPRTASGKVQKHQLPASAVASF